MILKLKFVKLYLKLLNKVVNIFGNINFIINIKLLNIYKI